jgi:hypothetical protein
MLPLRNPLRTELLRPHRIKLPLRIFDPLIFGPSSESPARKEYQAGVANYHAGKHDEAKQNFDDALNALLSSNLDVRSDDRLQKEFDRIVKGVNELYPGGTAADDQSQKPRHKKPQQKSEPAPIDITNGNHGVLRRRCRHRGQGPGGNQEHPLRPAADDDRPGRRLHHLLLGPRTRRLRARLLPAPAATTT